MRIGVLTHNYPRFQGDFSGIFIRQLSEELVQQGDEVHIVAPYDAAYTHEVLQTQNPRIHLYRYAWSDSAHQLGYMRTMRADISMRLNTYVLSPALFLRGENAVRRIAREQQLDLLHAHWVLPNGYIGAGASRDLGIPLVVSIPGSDALVAGQNPLFRRMAQRAFRQAGLITANSTSLRDVAVAKLGADPTKFELVIYAVDPEKLRPDDHGTVALRRRLGIPAEAFIFLAVGRMVPKKGYDVLLRALSFLRQEGGDASVELPPVHTILIGDGDLCDTWQRLAADLRLKNVHWVGRVPNDEISVYYNAADALVMPSVTAPADGLNVCVLDAMACAKPVIGSDCAGNDLVIEDGRNGYIVPEGDPMTLAAAMQKLIANPGQARSMGQTSRDLIETRFGWPQIAAHYRQRYAELVEGSKG